MLRYRKVLLVLSMVIVVGSLSTTLGYALRVRSDAYRRGVEARLSQRLGMRLTIGSIEPLSFRSRRLTDISLVLARRATEVFECERAVWRDESRNGLVSYSLDLQRGWLLVGAREWERADYQEMLRSGLGHDFAALHIGRIHLEDIDLKWTHPAFTLTAADCSGQIEFDRDGTGRASLVAGHLNAVAVGEPVKITAQFTPGAELRFHNVVLTVPEAPLSALKLDSVLGGPVTQGGFAGSISYRDRSPGWDVTVSGLVHDALLREVTRRLVGGPYDGQVDILLDEATFSDGALRALHFSGRLGDLRLEQLGRVLRIPGLSGRVDLRIHRASYAKGQVQYLSAEGRATDLPLNTLTDLFGRGRITGTMTVNIESLLVVDGQLTGANVTLEAVPPANGPGTIDRAVLKTATERLLGFDATALLPPGISHIEYVRLGVRLAVNRGELRVHGTHGNDGRTILTVKLFGREFGVIKEPKTVYRIDALLESLRERIDQYDAEQIREWLRLQGVWPADAAD